MLSFLFENVFRIQIPGEESLRLSDKFPSKNPLFVYYGEGLEQGYCGVSVQHVKAINNGKVTCILGLEQDDVEGHIDLVVACKWPKHFFLIFDSVVVVFFLLSATRVQFQYGGKFRSVCYLSYQWHVNEMHAQIYTISIAMSLPFQLWFLHSKCDNVVARLKWNEFELNWNKKKHTRIGFSFDFRDATENLLIFLR